MPVIHMGKRRSFRSQRLLSFIALLTIHATLFQFLAVSFLAPSSHVNINNSMFVSVNNSALLNNESQSASIDIFHETARFDSNEQAWSEGNEKKLQRGVMISSRISMTDELVKMKINNRRKYGSLQDEGFEAKFSLKGQRRNLDTYKENDTVKLTLDANEVSKEGIRSQAKLLSPKPFATHLASISEVSEYTLKPNEHDLLPTAYISGNSKLAKISETLIRESSKMPYMKTSTCGSPSSNPKVSMPDIELLNARIQIENAPIIRDAPLNYASLFRNYSTFVRSYELMEQMLRVYIYKEGERPIFHDPFLKGIYASEGWFMHLLKRNKHFVVQDPSKAHLFYVPLSSRRLRRVLLQHDVPRDGDVDNHLEDYVQIIAAKYSFWNRTRGADHFLVACHDWALNFTRKSMKGGIRAVCNSNPSEGFQIGKDVSLPATMVHHSKKPLGDFGGSNPPERDTLAFFSGELHGDLRPTLLKQWNNKTSDMKIFGPLGYDAVGVARYKELMRNSKYCICAKGYEVYSPRLIESIYYECVPVIIADNYVPPFYDIFKWESFAVFVPEKDIPNLRSILLSIPEDKYIRMQSRVKMVQQHFLWHRKPVKYDLFHMILHSIWHKRVFQIKI